MPIRHTVYCKRSAAAVTPENLLRHLNRLDFLTLGEDYELSEDRVEAALPLRIENTDPSGFGEFRLCYGKLETRPIDIDRWTGEQHRGAVEETVENLTIEDQTRVKRISDVLRGSVDSVSISFGIDPPAAMFAWEVVRYLASEFEGIIEADDGEWLMIEGDYQARRL